MKIYLAGKITGLELAAAAECFEEAERCVHSLGHEPLNPMKLVDQRDGRCWEDYMLDALKIVFEQAHGVYMLANWRQSLGARIEHAIAEIKGLPIYYQASDVPENS